MKELLFKLPLTDMETIFERYSEKVPDALHTQFENKADKGEAFKHYLERKFRKSTELFPSGISMLTVFILPM